MSQPPIHPGTRIGHVHLKVSDLERSVAFYTNVLGFEVTTRYGRQAAFLSAGGYHHHIALNTWESKGGSPPPPGTTGLYHVAIRYPDRKTLAQALKTVLDAGIRVGASDHGVSGDLPAGSGRERRRALLRSPARRMASRHGHAAARPAGAARRGWLTAGCRVRYTSE